MSDPIATTDEESNRVSLQVTSLSTQLMELVEKQSKLEEQLLHQKKENAALKKGNQELVSIQESYKSLQTEHEQLLNSNQSIGKKLESETNEKLKAKDEVSKLQSEVEELSASLFDEANKMVSTARKEAHDIQLRNDRLISELKDKDLLLDNLQSQLKELKNVIHERDDDSTNNSIRNSYIDNNNNHNKSSSNLDLSNSSINPQVIYAPIINSIRFDLKFYNEFKKFISDLKYIEQIKDTNTKFLKKLVTDDVEPALRIDSAAGIGWYSKRTLMTAFIEGRVVIEPVSGINETYRINFQSNKINESDVKSNLYTYPAHSPPVAIEHPCAICSEMRNDILEHSRLYTLKVHAPKSKDDLNSSRTASPSPSSPVIAHQYALCSYCLFKVRSACELFAFLRSLKNNVWKLDDEISIRKAWLELTRLRAKLFWSNVGIWDLESNIQQTKIYPGNKDHIYKILSNLESPNYNLNSASTNGTRSTRSSIEQKNSLNDSFGLQTPSADYKASPLIHQVSAEDISSPPSQQQQEPEKHFNDDQSPEPTHPITLKEPAKVLRKPAPTASSERINTSTEIPTIKTTNHETEKEKTSNPEEEDEDEDDATNDFLNDYSQDEDEEESPIKTPKTEGLLIKTERPQDFILNSDEEDSTPIIPKINEFNTKTPTKDDSGFSFSPEDTKLSLNKTPVLKKDEPSEIESSPEKQRRQSKDNETTDDEEFVDA
ncbi:Guanine nucleotide exchange factor for Rab3A [Wickerhamomyces ciferrii]|uniref:Guanine nucleotide exchange factor for Rab3A n=1 Tax=Wickerhamomyces ciferrii (strain ATCC 14091 / BCRC 22168 / CBS 111 / JCM 3599 / NBRC 0793 / NRRL Y-1031 F-60-10) TaxID=1206466 RepID=K0KRQ8_WICCF|nr:Guanine nucleotide exchange factor for Rab3A [Wickerhamomyces ciferrii]CCH45781.1 Guanine nucleotide exchange factor for Rab3A [Wickerhamomyces ciferrii]